MKKILAIDPGASGGFAWFNEEGIALALPMPETEGDIVALLRDRFCEEITTVYIEHVVGFIPSAGAGAMFSFGENFGFVKGVCQALRMKMVLVRPPMWQKFLSLGSKKEYEKQWKNHLKERAQQIYPNTHITLKTADALLILDYAIKNEI